MPGSNEPWPGNMKAIFVILRLRSSRGSTRSRRSPTSGPHPFRSSAPVFQVSAAHPPTRRRGRGDVPVSIDVDDHLLLRDAQLPRRVVDDPDVGLVRDVDVDVVDGLAALV